jgi:CubicO group peptidase (beta-lactamase class C family)
MTAFRTFFSCIVLIFSALPLFSQSPALYFPPKVGNTWQTTAPSSLGFCQERIDSLYQFLEDKNTKSFLLLKDGKIVLEKYFGTYVQDSIWYWASAGKSLSAFLVGQAQDEGLLDIQDPTSTYLGNGWTSATPEKEALITIWHQLTMTNGLEDIVPDANCTDPACLIYKADAGTRWAYHNAPYHLIHDVLESASGTTLNLFTKTRLLDQTGMKGLWLNHIFYSKARDMARYGLLALAGGIWDGDTLLHDQQFVYDMSHRSQNLNKSYGYLWWLNGQESFMLPGLQIAFPGKLIPNAPDDMYSALGKNDQKIHVVPSKGWVLVRQGNDAGIIGPGGGSVPIAFDNQLWDYLNQLDCTSVATHEELDNEPVVTVFPNPTQEQWQLKTSSIPERIELYDVLGTRLRILQNTATVDATSLGSGIYWLKIWQNGGSVLKSVVKQ